MITIELGMLDKTTRKETIYSGWYTAGTGMHEKCGGSYKKLVDSTGRCCEEYFTDTTAIREYEKANEEKRGFEDERLV